VATPELTRPTLAPWLEWGLPRTPLRVGRVNGQAPEPLGVLTEGGSGLAENIVYFGGVFTLHSFGA